MKYMPCNLFMPSLLTIRIFFTLISITIMTMNNIALAVEKEKTKISQEHTKVINLVTKAKKYIEMHGKEKAIAEFNKTSGDFTNKSSYIYAVDYEGVCLANINHPHLVGQSQLTLKDPLHIFYVKEEIEMAKSGGGWINARLKKNPHTGQKECKNSYLIPMPGNYFIGSGYYYSPEKDGSCK